MISIGKEWQTRLLRWGPGGVTALLVVAVGVRLAEWTWDMVAPPSETPSHPVAPGHGRADVPATGRDAAGTLQRLLALKPFGDAGAQPIKPAVAAPEVKVSRLNYQLRAIFITDGHGDGMCIISVPENNGKTLFRVGDTLSPGVVVHEIRSTEVILSRAGSLEALRFPVDGPKPAGPAAAPAIAAAPVPVGRNGAGAPDRSNADRRTPTAAPARRAVASGTVAPKLIQRVQANPMELGNLVQGELVEEGGRVKGLRIAPGQDRAAFAGAGLQAGDIIVAVNGIPVEQTNEVVNILHQLDRMSSLQVTVERKGQVQDLAIAIGGP